jgi:hypothetical protein
MTTLILIVTITCFAFGAGFIAGVKNANSSKVTPFKG